MLLTKLTWQLYRRFCSLPIADLGSFGGQHPVRQRSILAARLLDQVHYFGTREDALPEWREAARIRQPEELWRIWPSLPVITKDILNSRFEPVSMARRFKLHGRVNATGGSTGEPTRFFLDSHMLRASRGGQLYSRLKMGWTPGMATVIVWGADRDIGKKSPPAQHFARKLYNDRVVPGFAFDDGSVAQVLSIIRAEGPVAIYGFSSLLELLAERVLQLGLQPRPGVVAAAWNGGEMLYDSQVELFRRAFGVPILNRYGGRELSIMAFQDIAGGPLHILRPWLFLEVLDHAGKPSAPGEMGRLIWTSTISRGTPFLRYDIGDLGTYADGDHDESGIRAIHTLHGRSSGCLRLSDGRAMSCLYWNHLFKDYAEIKGFQVRIQTDGALRVLLTGRPFGQERDRHLRASLQHMLKETPIRFEWTSEIPKTAQGKLVQVVHE